MTFGWLQEIAVCVFKCVVDCFVVVLCLLPAVHLVEHCISTSDRGFDSEGTHALIKCIPSIDSKSLIKTSAKCISKYTCLICCKII